MKRLKLKPIDYVLAIAENQSFSLAAEKLFISQPSLSRYIANLENQYGFRLFERGQPFSKITLTAEGEIFLKYAGQIAGLTAQMADEIRHLQQAAPDALRIGIPLNSLTIHFEKIKQGMAAQYPQLSLQLVSLHSSEIEQALRDAKIDLAICYEYNLSHMTDFLPLHISQPLLAIVPRAWDVCGRAEEKSNWPWPWLEIRHLDGLPFIKLRPKSNIGLATDRLLEREQLIPDKIVVEAYSSLDVIHHAEIGMGYGFISSGLIHFIKHPEDVCIFTVGKPLELMRIGAATLKGSPPADSAKDLLQIFHEVVLRDDRYSFQDPSE